MSISPAIALLLTRMDSHPDEFVRKGWDIDVSTANFFYQTRWGSISNVMTSGAVGMFTPEEAEAYINKVTLLVRGRIDEGIIEELVGQRRLQMIEEMAEQDAQHKNQASLPFAGAAKAQVMNKQPSGLITPLNMAQQGLQILNTLGNSR